MQGRVATDGGRGQRKRRLRTGVAVVEPEADVVRWAAWTAYARVLLNLDEFITRE